VAERRDFYVYVIFRLYGSPCYVGKGQKARWLQHANGSHNKRLAAIYAAAGGDLPIVKIRENLTNAEACAVEMAMIGVLGRGSLGPLVNLTDGGDGCRGHSPSAETRIKKRISGIKRGVSLAFREGGRRYARNRPPEWHEKQRASHLGKKATPITRYRMSVGQLARRGKTQADAVPKRRKTKAELSEAQRKRNAGNKYGIGNKKTPEGQARSNAGVSAANRLRVPTKEYRELRRKIAKRLWARRRIVKGQGSLDI
jgi:hypothetical protein